MHTKLDNMKIKFGNKEVELRNGAPQKEGYYIWLCNMFEIMDSPPEIVHVVYYPPDHKWGISTGGYYGIANHRGRNVLNFNRSCDFWSDEIVWG